MKDAEFYWEGSVIYNYLYREKANERFIPCCLARRMTRAFRFACRALRNIGSGNSTSATPASKLCIAS